MTAPSLDSASLGHVFAQSTENDDRPPRELSDGWELFGQALLIYCGVLLIIAILLLIAQAIHGNLMASVEEQRTRDEWYRTRNDDDSWWLG